MADLPPNLLLRGLAKLRAGLIVAGASGMHPPGQGAAQSMWQAPQLQQRRPAQDKSASKLFSSFFVVRWLS